MTKDGIRKQEKYLANWNMDLIKVAQFQQRAKTLLNKRRTERFHISAYGTIAAEEFTVGSMQIATRAPTRMSKKRFERSIE
jgi:hypothetical protein